MLKSALWSTANWMPLMTSRTSSCPASSEALIEIRFASGRDADVPAAQRVARGAVVRVAGDDAGDVRAVAEAVAGGRGARVVTTAARSRARSVVEESRKSGMSPAMPVSMTATPTPLPVAVGAAAPPHRSRDWIDWLKLVASVVAATSA